MNDTGKKNLLSQASVISMGFTQSMIKKLLPPPTLKTNPMYRSAAPMKLWEEETVLAVMETQEYKSLWEKAKERQKKASCVAKIRSDKLCEEAEGKARTLQVKVLKKEVLLKRTLEEKAEWYCETQKLECDDFKLVLANNVKTADEETKSRWVVNYIRHNLVDIENGGYDEFLFQLKGKVGINAYLIFRQRVLEKIAQIYPEYADECLRQIKEASKYS